jgi:hypothetical protein
MRRVADRGVGRTAAERWALEQIGEAQTATRGVAHDLRRGYEQDPHRASTNVDRRDVTVPGRRQPQRAPTERLPR